jgi:hypothetical protein
MSLQSPDPSGWIKPAGSRMPVRIPGEVARESGMMSPTNPI